MTTRTAQPLLEPWKITLMAAVGTLLPLLLVALAFAFTPLPVTPQAAEVLRLLVRMAALFIGINAVVVTVVATAHLWVSRRRRGGQALSA